MELKKAQAEYDAFAGPSSFPKLIAQIRKEGILMPFKVNVTKGSPLALTVWEDSRPPTTDKATDNVKGKPKPDNIEHGGKAADAATVSTITSVGGKPSVNKKTGMSSLLKAETIPEDTEADNLVRMFAYV